MPPSSSPSSPSYSSSSDVDLVFWKKRKIEKSVSSLLLRCREFFNPAGEMQKTRRKKKEKKRKEKEVICSLLPSSLKVSGYGPNTSNLQTTILSSSLPNMRKERTIYLFEKNKILTGRMPWFFEALNMQEIRGFFFVFFHSVLLFSLFLISLF